MQDDVTRSPLHPLASGGVWRASSRGIEIKLRVERDGGAWLVIRKPHSEPSYRELADGEVAKVLAEFQAIGEDPEKFRAFVDARC